MLLALTLISGVIFPAAMWGISALLFPHQAEGSLVRSGGVRGSELIGQNFSRAGYFWGRPSAASPAYNAAASSGSNLGPSNLTLRDAVAQRVAALRAADPENRLPVPVDLVTASGSGLDPHISVAAARYQIGRVARARRMNPNQLLSLVNAHVEGPQFFVLGEARVSVLLLNMDLDQRYPLG
jgi:K+-transporting ATPase ATPase C chain